MAKLTCKKHYRILIGKTQCLDCASLRLEKHIKENIDIFKRLATK